MICRLIEFDWLSFCLHPLPSFASDSRTQECSAERFCFASILLIFHCQICFFRSKFHANRHLFSILIHLVFQRKLFSEV